MSHLPRAQIELDDQWSVAQGVWNDRPIIMRLRTNAIHFAGHPDFSDRMTVAWSFPDSESGLPDGDTLALMEHFEDRLIGAFEREVHAIAVAVVTHAGTREWIFYSSNLSESQKRLNDTFKNDKPYPLRLEAVNDPEWAEYRGMLQNCGEGA